MKTKLVLIVVMVLFMGAVIFGAALEQNKNTVKKPSKFFVKSMAAIALCNPTI